MRICLTTTSYPPEGTGGIPRQRQILASALARLGHEVHVILQGKRADTLTLPRSGVVLHVVPLVRQPLHFLEKFPYLDQRLMHSLAIQEQVRVLNQQRRLDVLDTPLWALEGLVPIHAAEVPAALWLQTSFAQMADVGQRALSPDDAAVIALEKECLRRAPGIIADSGTVLRDFERIYGLSGLQERARVIHLGLPDLPADQRLRAKPADGTLEALLVGRLEKRKGTSFIFDVLPELLRADPRLHVRFIGADNSRWDGFYQEQGLSYVEYFRQNWPGLRGRVIFEGSVSDRRLVEAYRQADLMLVPSLYESFGLIYLEAMRAGLPIVTFRLGAAPEIFPHGEGDGAVLVPPEDGPAFVEAVHSLLADAPRREAMGACGRERFTGAFLDTQMAEQTVEYYRQIAGPASTAAAAPRPRRIFQVMEALVPGDAVSSITLRNAELLHELHAGGTILSLHQHPDLAGKSRPVDTFDIQSNAALIFHYWNYSSLEGFARSFSGPKAIHFHNITPPEFFSPGSPGYESTSRGYAQLPRIANLFDLLIGDSVFNLESLKPYLDAPKPGIVIYPVIEAEAVRTRPYDTALLEQLNTQPGLKLLFVGRIARNKRQDRLIELLDALARLDGQQASPPRLYLVGGDQGDPAYRAELDALRTRLPIQDQVILTGKVSDAALNSYYRAADVFVSASEHEGFGMPMVEAMALDVPVLAYAAGAVPETLGDSAVLLRAWDARAAAEQVLRLTADAAFRASLLEAQRANLTRFTASAAKEKLAAVVRFLQFGEQATELIRWVR